MTDDLWYAIIDGAGNLVSTGTVIADEASLSDQGYSAVALSGNPAGQVWNVSSRAFESPPPALNEYPKLAFIQRFTATEFVAFKLSSDANVQFFMYQLDHAITVVPQDASVQGALAYAVSVGLLTPDRAVVIGAN